MMPSDYQTALLLLERLQVLRLEDLKRFREARAKAVALDQISSEELQLLDRKAARLLLEAILKIRSPSQELTLELHTVIFGFAKEFVEAAKTNEKAATRYKQLSLGNTLLEDFEVILTGDKAGTIRMLTRVGL